MPHYLHQWAYKDREVRAMVTQPQDREEVVRVAVEAFGGKLHGFYFCFGDYDGACIAEFPNNETAMACLMSIFGEGGLLTLRTTPLMTPRELQDLGVAVVSYPRLLTTAALKGMMNAMKVFTEEVMGQEKLVARDDLQVSFEELNDLMGMKELDELERRYAGG